MEINYDDILKKALIRYLEIQFNDIPSEDEIDYEFSETFAERMDGLLSNLDTK